VVEDNADLAANICDFLEDRGHIVDAAADGVTGLHLASVNQYDALVLDLMLPALDGLTLCRRLRGEGQRALPVLMLTARASLDDKVAGFESGADDYLVKPFELRELELRLNALIRRARDGGGRRLLRVADLEYDLDSVRVTRGGRAVELAAMPLKILELLMKRSPNVVWRRDIEQAVWGDFPPDSDALRVHMHTLRSAIELGEKPPLLRTLRGIGYQIVDPDALPT